MKILLQVPEGLKTKALEIAKKLEKKGNQVLISCEPCYGGCDLRDKEAKQLNVDKIIHYGHTKFIDSDIPVDYEEYRIDINPLPILEKNIEKINYKRIGLITTLQFVDSLEKVKEFLESKGKIVEVGKGKNDKRKLYSGQILGCDITNAKQIENKVDCFLFIGSGRFHPLGLENEKSLFVLDIEKNSLEELNREKFLKQRLVAIELAKDCNKFGILISTKPGQLNLKLAEEIKNKIEKKGKKAFLLVFDEIEPEKLEGLDLDCYINTACPRLVDDRGLFKKPILNVEGVEEVFKT